MKATKALSPDQMESLINTAFDDYMNGVPLEKAQAKARREFFGEEPSMDDMKKREVAKITVEAYGQKQTIGMFSEPGSDDHHWVGVPVEDEERSIGKHVFYALDLMRKQRSTP